jgi:arylsulfatase
MAISWPGHIDDPGGIRNQFHHMIDIVPTILEAAQIQPPDNIDGIKQKPMEGVSMVYTFKKANTNAPSTHHTQYFEMMGDHAIYHDGWIASTKVMRPPWVTGTAPKESPANYPWELYDVTKDWTQADNVVGKYPAKLKELEALFWQEAEKYQVLPLDNDVVGRLITPKPSLSAGRTVFTYHGKVTGTPNGDAPSILNSSYNFKAEIDVPQGGGEGMLVTQGGRFGGYGFYILKGKPIFLWNLVDLKRIRWESPEALAPGKHTVEFDFKYDGLGMGTLAFGSPSGIGRGGTGVLKVDGKAMATQRMEHSLPFILQWDENFDVGADTGTPVDDQDYQVPFEFNGKIFNLTLTINRPQLTPADIEKLKEAQRNNKVSE